MKNWGEMFAVVVVEMGEFVVGECCVVCRNVVGRHCCVCLAAVWGIRVLCMND